jgi:hypothetical protein
MNRDTELEVIMPPLEEMDNPYFRLPFALYEEHFYGSMYQVRQALEAITSPYPAPLEFVGLPGMGKSVLLRYLADPQGALLRQNRWLQKPYDREPHLLFPIRVEFRLLPSQLHAFQFLYRRFQEEYPGYRTRTANAFENPLPEMERQPFPDEAETAVDCMEHDLRRLSALRVRPVLLLDDFDLVFGSLTFDQASRLRPWRDRVSFILCTEKSLDRIKSEAAGSPFFATIPIVHIDGLSPEEAQHLISQPARDAGRPFPDEDIRLALQLAGRHTYLLILAGRKLWNLRMQTGLLDQPHLPLPEAQRSSLAARLMADYQRLFDLYLNRLEPGEVRALAHLLPPRSENPHSEDLQHLESLVQLGLAELDPHLGYRIFSRLFEEYLQQKKLEPDETTALKLSDLEQRLYQYLRNDPDRISAFDELWQSVWEQPFEKEKADSIKRTIQVTVSRLRKKLLATGEDILSLRDQGYRLTR